MLYFVPFLLFLALVPLTPFLDLVISSYYYPEGFSQNPLWQWFFTWGTLPAWIVACGAVALLFVPRFRRASLLYLLSFALGAGVMAQLLLKNLWTRPRPVQTDLFGGFAPYTPLWQIAAEQSEPMRSMPCGHCTMGFVFLSLLFAGIRLKNPWILWLGLTLLLIFGLGLSLARLAQGGHYFSDVLSAFMIMWFSTLIADFFLFRRNRCL